MKVIDLLSNLSSGITYTKKARIRYFDRKNDYEDECILNEVAIGFRLYNQNIELNDEVEIIEEKKKFTKEDFINERMEIDKITRKEFDEMYEVKECNCGMPYCKGFIAVDKEEPQEHKIPEKLPEWATRREDKEYTNQEHHILVVARKVDEILDYLEEIE